MTVADGCPPLLKLRAREAVLVPNDDAKQLPIVEVLRGDAVVGQLPATRVAYQMLPGQFGKLTVEINVAKSEVCSRD